MKRGLTLSFIFHVLVLAFLWLQGSLPGHQLSPEDIAALATAQRLKVRPVSPEQLEKDLKSALEEHESQIVQTDDRFESPEAGERKGKTFLTRKNQKVDFETRAENVGHFKNTKNPGSETNAVKESEKKKSVAKEASSPAGAPTLHKLLELPPSERELAEIAAHKEGGTGRLRAPASIPNKIKGDGVSATDDYLKDIATGAQTLLNAKEYKFYGFYERVREKISDRWKQNLDIAFDKIMSKRDAMGAAEQLTQVQVRLKDNGQLESIRIMGSSGSEDLDGAAVEAFRQAAPFPNPPREMLDAKNIVQIRWDFVVVSDGDGATQVRVRRAVW
ncbi:MAG: energy transducer TonB [Bdellovibrionales bacterium]|nr:energy transducer TonB [Bdellovibrionales bacterium]